MANVKKLKAEQKVSTSMSLKRKHYKMLRKLARNRGIAASSIVEDVLVPYLESQDI